MTHPHPRPSIPISKSQWERFKYLYPLRARYRLRDLIRLDLANEIPKSRSSGPSKRAKAKRAKAKRGWIAGMSPARVKQVRKMIANIGR